MRLNLREIIHTPGASLPFAFQMDLSDLEFNGQRPAAHPIEVEGVVKNTAGALVLVDGVLVPGVVVLVPPPPQAVSRRLQLRAAARSIHTLRFFILSSS